MLKLLLVVAICLFLEQALCFNVPAGNLTVSGLSSGGFMAVQFHVAHSSMISGAAIIAGGPYYCAQGDLVTATTACTDDPSLIDVSILIGETDYAELLLTIDKTKYLANDRVYLFSGTLDRTVYPGVVEALQTYYTHYIEDSQIFDEFDIPATHAMITDNYGNACAHNGTPFINNCNYSAAGELFQWLYPNINFKPQVDFDPSNIVAFNQGNFTPLGLNPHDLSLNDEGYIYVPTACQDSSTECQLHVAFHGCAQDPTDVGNIYYMHAGYNQWAESNNIIVIYPQTTNSMLVPYNPYGCWDWWGYTGEDYATNLAPQIITVKNIVNWIPTASMADLTRLKDLDPDFLQALLA